MIAASWTTGLEMAVRDSPKKLCFDCRKLLSLSSFRRDGKNEDGLRRRCKACDALRLEQRKAEAVVASYAPCSTPFSLRIFSAIALSADLTADRRVPMPVWHKSLPLPSVRFGPLPAGGIHEDFEDHYAKSRAQRYGWVARDHAHDMEAARPEGSPVPSLVPRVAPAAPAPVVLAAVDAPAPRARPHRSAATEELDRERHKVFMAREALRLERKQRLVSAYASSFPSFDDLFAEARAEALASGRDSWVIHGVEWRSIPYLPRFVSDGSAVPMFCVEAASALTSTNVLRGSYVVPNVIGLVSR